MALTARQVISMRAPQWASDPRIEDLAAYAQQGLSINALGDRYGEAIGLKVLHFLTVEAGNGGNPGVGTNSGSGGTGMLSAESVGDISRSYVYAKSNGSANVDDLSSTQYGQELIKLLRSCVLFARTRM